MMMLKEDLRSKLEDALLAQSKVSKKLAGSKETIMKIFGELHPKRYEDFLLTLEDSEKQELVEAVADDEKLLQQLIAWIDDVALKSLIRATSDSAVICQQLPYDRFKQILRDLDSENIFRIFKKSTDEQRVDIIEEALESQLTGLLTFACQQSGEELAAFLRDTAEALNTLPEPVEPVENSEGASEETENSVENETEGASAEAENVSKENDAQEYISPEKCKVLLAISDLKLYEQIMILKNQPDGWTDYILEEILKKSTVREIRDYLTMEETIWVMVKTNSIECFDNFLNVISNENVDWTSVSRSLQMELLEDLEINDRDIVSIFEIKDLCRLYFYAGRQEREFLLKQVLPVLKVEANVYQDFYAGLLNKDDQSGFLEIMYEEVTDKPAIAGKIYRLLLDQEEKTTLEKVYMNSFRALCPGIDAEEHMDLAK